MKNFSEVSEELIVELREVFEEGGDQLSQDDRELIQEISQDLSGNLERIRSHGDRANRIVHDMLMMGRGSAEWQSTDINSLVDEYARLAFHSARATDPNFQLDLKQNLDPEMGELEVIPQDMGRVFLNMAGNACYATDEKRRTIEEAGTTAEPYAPTLSLTTKRMEHLVEVRIRDNGNGMPPEVVEKIFNPFFTTKPTGQGTGLGLALSSDIVREHGGNIRVETEPGEFTEMIVELPLKPPARTAGERTGTSRTRRERKLWFLRCNKDRPASQGNWRAPTGLTSFSQPTLALSRAPRLIERRFQPRHVKPRHAPPPRCKTRLMSGAFYYPGLP